VQVGCDGRVRLGYLVFERFVPAAAQTGKYAPGTPDLTDPTKFIIQGEKRYWLHIALDRDDGTVLGTQLEEVVE
jgi:hypothetical protein